MSQSRMPVAAASNVSTDLTTDDEKNGSMSIRPPDIVSTSSKYCWASLPDGVSGA